MIGPLEIAIIVVILLVIFGASFLPRLGRAAGRGVRIGGEKGKELGAVAGEKAKEVDTAAIARTAGENLREARELRDVVKGETKPSSGPKAGSADSKGGSSDPETDTGSGDGETRSGEPTTG